MPKTFLTSPAGTSKTTQAVARLRGLLCDPALPGASAVDILTLNGLARQTISLFWLLVADAAGFGRPQTCLFGHRNRSILPAPGDCYTGPYFYGCAHSFPNH